MSVGPRPPVPTVVPDLGPPGRFHVIGAGGAAMSAIVHILLEMGHTVSGSDQADSELVGRLRSEGATIHVGHARKHVEGAGGVIFSTAIRRQNPELDAAISLGIPLSSRGDAMEAIAGDRTTAAVSGTAGKTTTSALLALIMSRCGRDPSIIVGGAIHQLDTGVRWRRDSGWLVVEADESDGSFLRFGAEHVVITNIQPDHLDLWGTMAELEAGFDRFAGQAVEQRGTVRLGIDDAGSRALLGRLGREHGSVPAGLASYGFAEDADYRIVGFTSDGLRSKAEVLLDGEPLCHLRLAVPGRHNAANATAALASAHGMGVDLAAAAAAIEDFRGVARRFELRGEAGGVRFFDDYAHLPMKIAAAVEAGRLATGPGGRLVVVFQPHRYTRTRDLGPELAAALEGADVIVVTGIYAAGQDPIPGITGEHVAEQARAANPGIPVHHVEERGRVAEVVADLLQPGDVCVTLNAGDLVTLPDELMAALG